MKITEAKLLFQAEVMGEPVIRRAGDQGWMVVLEGKHQLNPELETARGGVRVFRTVDAAVGVVFELGFSELRVVDSTVAHSAPRKRSPSARSQ